MKLELGQKVTIKSHLERNSKYKGEIIVKYYDRVELDKPVDTFICGMANIHYLGESKFDPQDGPVFESFIREKAYKVPLNMKQTVYIQKKDITKINGRDVKLLKEA